MCHSFIQSERIYFCKWTENKLNDANYLWGDPNVTKYISASGIFSESQIKSRLAAEIDNQLNYGIQYWPFYEKNSKEIIGCCGFRPYNGDILEFGIHIRSLYWRQGLAFEAGSAAIGYCISHKNPEKIIAGHNPNNLASAAMLKKLGFVFTHNEFYEPTGLMHPTYALSRF